MTEHGIRPKAILALLTLALSAPAAERLEPRDLTPVSWMETPTHASVEVVRAGKARAVVYIANPNARIKIDPEIYRRKNAGTPPALQRLLLELIDVVRIRTGATLELVQEPPPPGQPALVIGDCDETRQAGIDAAKLPPEGFEVKTAENRVFLVGGGEGRGDTWAVADFLERFAGVRWYWRAEYGGRSIPREPSLSISPAHYRDQPVFRKRFHYIDHPWPYAVHSEGHNTADQMPLPFPPEVASNENPPPDGSLFTPDLPLMRHGDSVDFQCGLIQGHSGLWLTGGAINKDGSRHNRWVCYSSPQTLEDHIKKLEPFWDTKSSSKWTHQIITPESCTLYLPNSPGMPCHCPPCTQTAARFRDNQELRKTLTAQYSDRRAFEMIEERVHLRVFGLFMKRFCETVKQRWPDKKVVFRSAGMRPPEDVQFPDNLRVEALWPASWWSLGLAMHPSVGRGYEEIIGAWGVPVVIEGSASSPSDWTYGPVAYPHLIKEFYLRNRANIQGSTLTIFCSKIYIADAPTYYVWSRVLWNPDLDVEATLDGMCQRLFGPGADAARQLLRLQCERWEKTALSRPLTAEDRHPSQVPGRGYGLGTLAQEWRIPDDLYREIWPADVVVQMKQLRDQALSAIERGKDKTALQAFLYWTWTFDAFLEEAQVVHRQQPTNRVQDQSETPLASAEGLPETLALNLGEGIDLKLALIRPGEFQMGSAKDSWGHHRNEGPPFRVRITKPFYMGLHEVTEAQYECVTGTNPSKGGKNRPVTRVSWNDATNFCDKLALKTGRTARLPSEAEWEYACRAGTKTQWSFGDLDKVKTIDEYAYSGKEPQDAGTKKPNAWGLFDMHGNAHEWCRDRFAADYYAWAPSADPSGPEAGLFRVIRGGSSRNLACRNEELLRSARRAYGHPDVTLSVLGFRVVIEAGTEQKK